MAEDTDAAVPWEACVMRSLARGRLWLESVLGTGGAWAPRSAPRRGVLMDRGPPISKRLLVTAAGQLLRGPRCTPHVTLPASSPGSVFGAVRTA